LIQIAIIGGTGLEHADILQNATYINCTTPFGQPSDSICTGTIDGVECYLLARHGRQHDKSPTNINYRANIWSLFQLGVTHIIVSTACGSLRDEIGPGDLVFIDQFIDRY
jgi:5'-methylthioadenosine phosphorylase